MVGLLKGYATINEDKLRPAMTEFVAGFPQAGKVPGCL